MDKGSVLTGIARAAIAGHLGLSFDFQPPDEVWLNDARATFVTLHKNGALRGCIGSLMAHRSLIEDVRLNAVSAAFHDPRFAPLSADELNAIDIEVSVLSPPERIYPASEKELPGMLRPGVDGIILSYGSHRGTFLPQVWQQLPTSLQFLSQLKLKAGLPADFWSPDIEVSRYTVEAFSEQGHAS